MIYIVIETGERDIESDDRDIQSDVGVSAVLGEGSSILKLH